MVHTYRLLGRRIAVDAESGAVHLLDEAALRCLEGKPPETPEEYTAQAELEQLRQAGLLDCPAAAVDLPEKGPLKALCLHVSHDCNLRCGYCFAGTGAFGGTRVDMPPEVGMRAIDFLIAHSENRRNLEIDFFGGEPLLALDTVKAVVRHARGREAETGKRFRFTLTTNGLLLDDDTIRYLNETMDNIVLSLDGRPETNDALRKTPDGRGSYAQIVPAYRRLTETREGSWFVRGTFTRRNPDFLADLLHLLDAGFAQLSLEPVVLAPGHPLALTAQELPVICAAYERLAELMLTREDFSFFHFNVDLSQGPCVYKRIRGCGAGTEYAAVTPDGSLYPCHQFAGRPEYRLGSLGEGITNPSLGDRFHACTIFTRKGCADCWAKYYCSGGCSASNLTTSGSLDTPDELSCQLQRKRLECAIALSCVRYERINSQPDG